MADGSIPSCLSYLITLVQRSKFQGLSLQTQEKIDIDSVVYL